jgi:hypothetical protein
MLTLIFYLVVIGVVLYLVNNIVPMQPPFPLIINCVVGLCLLWYVIQFLGGGGLGLPAPRPLFR